MNKISERIDLSKKVLDLDIYSPVFKSMLDDLNLEIQRVIKSVYDGNFAGGEIAAKLELKIVQGFEDYATTDEAGNVIQETYKYKKPDFAHKITTTLKKQYKQEGSYSEKREVVFDETEGKFIAKPIINPQLEFKQLARLENKEGEEDE